MKQSGETGKWGVVIVDKATVYYEKACQFARNQNYRQAFIYYSAAAELGHLEAVYQMGLCYQEGWGVRCDPQTAFSYFMQAAQDGHAAAQNRVGECLEQGKGVKRDRTEATAWYLKAAKQKNGAGVYNLGRSYESGSFDKRNLSMAFQLYERAAGLGYKDARRAADRLRWVTQESKTPEGPAPQSRDAAAGSPGTARNGHAGMGDFHVNGGQAFSGYGHSDASGTEQGKGGASPLRGGPQPSGQTAGNGGSAMEELNSLIGLESVKETVSRLRKRAIYDRRCREQGIHTAPPVMHMVFTGNPGTGKTTVARLVGEIYHEIGLLPKGHMVEVRREDLVGQFIGQSAPKTKEKIQEALGGVLFIDEAYSLSPEDSARDFGQEVINTLVAAMEDNRENLAVIVAGYKNEMERFINSNPGLQSRFKTVLHFGDYSAGDMVRIFCRFAKIYTFGDGAMEELRRICGEMYDRRGRNFGNAREVRNLYDDVITALAGRVSDLPNPTKRELLCITREDLLAAERSRA